MYYFLDTGPKFTGLVWLNVGGIARDDMSFRFWISCPILEIFSIKVGSCVKSRQISHVFDPRNFVGDSPKFLDWDYKAHPDVDHVFHGDRLSELGDLVAN